MEDPAAAAAPDSPAPDSADSAAPAGLPDAKDNRPDLHTRLAVLRGRCRSSLNFCGIIGVFFSLFIGWFLLHYLSFINIMILALIQTLISEYLNFPDDAIAVIMGINAMVMPLLFSGLMAFLIWRVLHSYFAKHYWRVTAELEGTGLMMLVVNDDWTRVIAEGMEQDGIVRWIGPPAPKSLEDQLEFAACFYEQLRLLQHGRRHLESVSFWSGAWSWFTGQRRWCFCACASPFCMGCPLALLAFWALSPIYYVQKIASTAAFCDFLLRGTPLAGPLPDIAKLQPRSMRERRGIPPPVH